MTRIRWTSHAASRYEKQTDAIKEISACQDMLSYGEGVRGEYSEIETRGTVASRVLMNPKAHRRKCRRGRSGREPLNNYLADVCGRFLPV
jgi:hypothetical protein